MLRLFTDIAFGDLFAMIVLLVAWTPQWIEARTAFMRLIRIAVFILSEVGIIVWALVACISYREASSFFLADPFFDFAALATVSCFSLFMFILARIFRGQ